MKLKVGLLLLLMSQTLHAQDSYADVSEAFGLDPNAGQNSFLILNIPSGGKYESMASAYTALAFDVGYMESNPSGSSFTPNTELSFFHVDWISDSAVESIYYNFKLKNNDNFGFGTSAKFLHVPFTGYNDWGQQTSAVGWYSETMAAFNMSYGFAKDYFGSNSISIGTNLKVAYRGVQLSLEPDQSSVSLMGDVGIMTRFNLFKFYASRESNFSVGVSARNLGTEFIDNPDPLPSSLTVGIGWAIIRPITLALDFSMPFNLDGSDAESFSGAIGLNFNITSFLDVQTGFLLKEGKPRFAIGSQIGLKDFDLMFNYTLDLATQAQVFNKMSIGFRLNLESAKHIVIKNDVQTLYLIGLDYYAQGNMDKAVEYFKNALLLNPDYMPAKDMLATVTKSLELEKDLRRTLSD